VVEMARKGSKYPQLNDKEWLYQKYWVEELSSRKIAEIVGCEKTAVLDALKRCAIQIRKRREWLKEKLDERLFDKKWLYCKYWIEGLSTYEIGLIIGCDRKTIQMSLKRYSIPRRSYSESLRGEMHHSFNKKKKQKRKRRNKKYVRSKEHIEKLREANLGRHPSSETRRKMGDAHRGRHYIPKESRERLSKMRMGENNPNWNNGSSFEPYCPKFNDDFKEYVREKFDRECFLCGKTEKGNGKRLCVHHVNYNKNCGCEEDVSCQFVPLCLSCHAKTNHNREYWEGLISRMLREKINGWCI